ncbi:unnamed protein product [Haemonchus placei]|uniref:COesterase domain-containing protein n=1 Tax=Haemonchus placei TaxID=6290 RepID=A0A0N4WWS8_HAEPC|nr:unnamed protein product [Haemonchus placei]
MTRKAFGKLRAAFPSNDNIEVVGARKAPVLSSDKLIARIGAQTSHSFSRDSGISSGDTIADAEELTTGKSNGFTLEKTFTRFILDEILPSDITN